MLGTLIIVTGLSGSGKTTLVDHALQVFTGAERVISCTTRKPRIGEENGVHYRFFSHKEFCARKRTGEFAEDARVYKQRYGTLKKDISETLEAQRLVFLVVDIQGALTLSNIYPDARVLFITTATNELTARLEERGASPEDIALRIAAVKEERAMMLKLESVSILENRNGALDITKSRFCLLVDEACTIPPNVP